MISEIEQKLVEMVMNYGHFFNDKNAASQNEDCLYICDAETYDLQLVRLHKNNENLMNRGDWHGRKCYEFLGGYDKPCPSCPKRGLRYDCHYVWTAQNEFLKSELFMKSILIDRNGRCARLQTATNVTSPERRDNVMNQYLYSRNVLTGVLGLLMDDIPETDTYLNICRDIGFFFNAYRVLITDYSTEDFSVCWSADEKPFVQIRTALTDEGRDALTLATKNIRFIWIPDVENADKLDPELRSYWCSAGIRSILMIPMNYNGEFMGTLSLHNMNEELISETDTLSIIAMAMAKNIYSQMLETSSEKNLYSDPLTGALNLSGLKKAAYRFFAENPHTKYSISVCDIRYFGGINRRFSFELGDRILQKTIEVFSSMLIKGEAVCRISADQFCLIRKFVSREKTEKDFNEFIEKMQCFDELKAANVKIDFQAGVYIPAATGNDVRISSAIDKANIARRTLKDFHGSKVAFFCDEMLENSKREIELIQDFKYALKHNEITVFYQPQCRYSENIIAGAEALVRWQSPKHGNVSPAEFIPLLERHGLIYELDRFVWELVCIHQQKWISMGIKIPISVNVSRYDMLREGICTDLCHLLEKYGIPKKLLPLEITETAYIKSSAELIEAVDTLKNAGFTVEMDDFGSGYSSLNALKDVAVDLLKLDMKFLDDKNESSRGRGGSILNCIVRMTRWLNLPVLAEGVETKEQAEYLKNIGCDLMQGYYFARPMSAVDFEALLTSNHGSPDIEDDGEMMSAGELMESVVTNPILFNHIGAAAIIEYHDKECEALLINDSFLEIIDMTREEYLPYMKQMNRYSVNIQEHSDAPDIFDNVVNGTKTHDFFLKRKDGSRRKIRLYCRRLLSDNGRNILLLTMDDITDLVEKSSETPA